MEARSDVTRTLALGQLGEPWQLLLSIFNQILRGVVRIRKNSSFPAIRFRAERDSKKERANNCSP
jgi:hypothetical protein